MNKKELEALNSVLEYLWQDEMKDYESKPEEEKAGHIFEEMKVLRDYYYKEIQK